MPTLENVVRPIVAVDVTPRPRTIPITDPAPQDDVILTFGKAGASVFTLTENRIFQFQVEDSEVKEISRKVDVYRVAHEDSPDSFVDIESVREITFRDKNGRKQVNRYTELDPARTQFASWQVELLHKNMRVDSPDGND